MIDIPSLANRIQYALHEFGRIKEFEWEWLDDEIATFIAGKNKNTGLDITVKVTFLRDREIEIAIMNNNWLLKKLQDEDYVFDIDWARVDFTVDGVYNKNSKTEWAKVNIKAGQLLRLYHTVAAIVVEFLKTKKRTPYDAVVWDAEAKKSSIYVKLFKMIKRHVKTSHSLFYDDQYGYIIHNDLLKKDAQS